MSITIETEKEEDDYDDCGRLVLTSFGSFLLMRDWSDYVLLVLEKYVIFKQKKNFEWKINYPYI